MASKTPLTPVPADSILVLNAGSSSLKFAVFRAAEGCIESTSQGQVEGLGTKPHFSARINSRPDTQETSDSLPPDAGHQQALALVLSWLERQGLGASRFRAVGHRIVHGGTKATRPTLINRDNLGALDELRGLAPLHNAFGLDAIHIVLSAMPDTPQVACFDTAFHATAPDVATRLPLPQSFHDEGYRRYGFHGLNYEHVVAELPLLSDAPLPERLLVFHLGNGCSICAIHRGKSVGTTMGYSTLDGLIMGTRTGSIDPGVLIALQKDKGLDVDALSDILYRKSGLLGLSGLTSDMRALLASVHPDCRRAVEHFCYWAARHAASLIVALGGLDAIVFTGGIGANAAEVRSRIIGHFQWLGIRLDIAANQKNETLVSHPESTMPVWIVPANEELAIARHTLQLAPF
jgi:acetate kinase